MAEERMTYRIHEIKLKVGEPKEHLPKKIAKKLGLPLAAISDLRLVRESVDARNKKDIHLVYTVDFSLEKPLRKSEREMARLKVARQEEIPYRLPEAGTEDLGGRPVIAGFGPCGIFAALTLARAGYRPIVLERGASMEHRIQDVEAFKKEGRLDPDSNVLFGEGGAGTFSDGKLTTGIKDPRIQIMLRIFYEAGAGEDVLYRHRPHIGTDVLREVIVRIREEILALGGEVRFCTKFTDLLTEDGELRGVRTISLADGSEEVIPTRAFILATGHSARDTFKLARDRGLSMEQKPFSIGVRMEHPQELIDRAQYGDERRLPPAEYKVSMRSSEGRGVYSFCMCPGGEVIACSTEEGTLCVNGMSNRKRDSGTANSGILCDVRTSDFGSDDVLAGVEFQKKYERLAYENGGGGFRIPTCRMEDFLADTEAAAPVTHSLPDFAVRALREAVPVFAKKIQGYDMPDAVIKAVETRSSSPVRILREKESGMSNIRGIYPSGEGCGYAGGITSAACDGMRQAEAIIRRFAVPAE